MEQGMLSTEQVLLLENLMYSANNDPLKSITQLGSGKTVADLVNIDLSGLVEDKDYGSYMTGKDWKNLIQAIKNDDTLMRMEIVSTHIDDAAGGGGGESALFANPDTGEAVVAFRGTAGNEWKDNFIGGAATDMPDGVSTQQQMNALEWYQSLDLDDYSTITVTGHSKGGNKAKYITIMDSSVDRCVSFDGQGFSDEFINEYRDLIAVHQDKIKNINAEYDYVNLLLNDVGNTTFYQGHDFGAGGFLENHCPNTMFQFNEDGTVQMIQVDGRAEAIEELDKFLNSYLRSVDGKDKKEVLETLGIVAEQGFSHGTIDDILDTLLEGNHVDQMAYLLAYFIKYEQSNPEFAQTIRELLREFGMDEFVKAVDIVDSIINWKYFDTIVDALNFLSDNVPEWMLDKLSKYILDNCGIALSVEELRKLLSVVGKINTDMDTIRILPYGSDIVIKSIAASAGDFSIKAKIVNDSGESLKYISRQLFRCNEEIESLSEDLSGIRGMVFIRLKVRNLVRRLEYESKAMAAMGNGAEEIAEKYLGTEHAVVENALVHQQHN